MAVVKSPPKTMQKCLLRGFPVYILQATKVDQAIIGLILMDSKFLQLILKGKIMAKNKNFITVSIPLNTYHVLKDMAEKNERSVARQLTWLVKQETTEGSIGVGVPESGTSDYASNRSR